MVKGVVMSITILAAEKMFLDVKQYVRLSKGNIPEHTSIIEVVSDISETILTHLRQIM